MTATTDTTNPLLQPWNAPFQLPPFATTRPEHFEPAFEVAMAAHRAEVDAIGNDPQPPTFDNTVAAFDRSGRLLNRISGMFHNLCSSESSEELRAVQRRMAVPLAAHANAVAMHEGLFRRLDALMNQRASLGLTSEQARLLERLHLGFVRSGALLRGEAQQRFGEIAQRLAELSTAFGQNVLHDESTWSLPLHGEADLAGLPDFVVDAARRAAAERDQPEGHAITLSR